MPRTHRVTSLLFLVIASLGFLAASAAADNSTGACTWSYAGDTGPGHWATMTQPGSTELCFPGCSNTTAPQQSPINLQGATLNNALKQIQFYYVNTDVEVENNGHNIEAVYSPAGQGTSNNNITYNGTAYYLLNFHFHEPSEHQIIGKGSRMELHLVHQAANGQKLVVGIMIKLGKANPVLQQVLTAAAGTLPATIPVGAAGLLPPASNWNPAPFQYYQYQGSLTVPPCTGSVIWAVLMTDSITATQAQIDQFKKILGFYNARPIQKTVPDKAALQKSPVW